MGVNRHASTELFPAPFRSKAYLAMVTAGADTGRRWLVASRRWIAWLPFWTTAQMGQSFRLRSPKKTFWQLSHFFSSMRHLHVKSAIIHR
jgi:hypothetical protein